jgi:hypothetical protein
MKGFIYIIRSKLTDDVYYGSTKKNIFTRMIEHQTHYKRHIKDGSKNYCYSFKIIQFADAYIQLVEEVEYEDKKQLTEREAFYIKNNV